ncbi:MAG: hypothetical protein ACR2MY_07995 [Candidatus Dormibacteria bacterium]
MSKLVYAEPDDEITNLVDRLRSEKTEKELVFVLPASSRVMHSSLNARLLMQYSNSLGKRTSVVSPDPRTQGVAIETGFDTFPSMAAFEAGRALDRAVQGRSAASPIAAGALGAGAVADIPAAATRRPPSVRGPVASPRAQPVAARPAAGAPLVATSAGGRRVGFLAWVLAAVGIFLIAMILVFFVLPTATVTITVAARPVSVAPTITGSTQPPADKLSVQTTLQQAQEQQQSPVTSTGQKIILGNAAAGVVTIKNTGNDPNCCVFKAGMPGEVTTADGKKFSFVPDADVIIFAGQSHDFAITAKARGTASNVGPHTITKVTTDQPLVADNANPTAGGTEPQTKTVVGQADIDKTKNALGATLSQKVRDDIKAKAGKDTVLADTQTIDVSISTDHQPGDEVPTFNATVTVKGKATTVSEDKLKALLKASLDAQVIAGYHLTDNVPKLTYTLVQHDENGGAVWNGSASGFQATAVSENDVRAKVSGKSPKEAVAYVQGHLDAQSASVTISPPFVPWLPFIAGNIKFRTQVQNAAPG